MLEKIKSLRDQTHLSMALCKKAIDATNGDLDLAIQYLQKAGEIKKIENIADASEGRVKAFCFPDKKLTVVLGLNCQTDFAAKSEIFVDSINKLSDKITTHSLKSDFKEELDQLSKKLGEAIVLKTLNVYKTQIEDELVEDCVIYNHHNNKMTIVLKYQITAEDAQNTEIRTFLENCAMQIAAMNPVALTRQQINSDTIMAQREIFVAQVPEKIKDPNAANKIVDGKMNKWFAENVLLEQEYLINPQKGKTLSDTLLNLKKEIKRDFNLVFLGFDKFTV
jgi:elongation factor Ts